MIPNSVFFMNDMSLIGRFCDFYIQFMVHIHKVLYFSIIFMPFALQKCIKNISDDLCSIFVQYEKNSK